MRARCVQLPYNFAIYFRVIGEIGRNYKQNLQRITIFTPFLLPPPRRYRSEQSLSATRLQVPFSTDDPCILTPR